jgi:DNA-binding NarL/FixJ family response regulator
MTFKDCSGSVSLPQVERRAPRILLVDSQTLFREAVRSLVNANSEFEIVGEAASAGEALERAAVLQPDIVVTDIPLPDRSGVQIVAELLAHHSRTRILVLTALRDIGRASAASRAGALGYILKECGRTELLTALGHVAAGRNYLCKALEVPRRRTRVGAPSGHANVTTALTDRQRQVLRSVALGYGTREIAQMLGVSSKSVQKLRSRIREALDVRSTAGLTAYAVREGLIDSR